MKTHRTRESGSVLIFAVLLLAVGAFVLAGIAQLAATQAVVGQNEWDTLNRLVKAENSRSMARQYVLQKMFSSVITNISYTNDSNLGGFTLSEAPVTGSYWTTVSTTNTNANLKINPFTLMERGGFYRVVIGGTISDGIDDLPWNFQIRTRSPVAAGYTVIQHMPANDNVSLLAGDAPHIDMNQLEQFIGFHEMARMRVSSVTNTDAGETNGYVGYLNVPIGVASHGLFSGEYTALETNGTNLQMVIDLGLLDSNEPTSVLVYEVPPQASFTNTNAIPPTTNTFPVTTVTLIGTEQVGRKPLQIIIPQSNTNVQKLALNGNNHPDWGRPVYVNYQRATNNGALQVVTTNATGSWRIGITARHSDISFDSGITIYGGIRTDGQILGSPDLRQELDPGGLDYIADRMMWLEDYKTP